MAASLWGLGCTTVSPLQTASTVRPETYRASLQASLTPWCGDSLDPRIGCASLPRGAPMPELRVAVRHGIAPGWDLGLSANAQAVVPIGAQAGLLFDAKHELWSAPLGPGRRQLVSLGLGAGYTLEAAGFFDNRPLNTAGRVDLVLPAFYGYQTGGWEWVASPRFVERLDLLDLNGDGRREVLDAAWYGVSLGTFRRSGVPWGLSFDYFAPVSMPGGGQFTFSAGFLWDLGGA